MDGLTVIEESRKEGFAGKFIILSCVSEIEYLQKAIRLGVSSYVLKSSVNPQEILETVEEAAAEIKKEKRVPMDLGISEPDFKRHCNGAGGIGRKNAGFWI